METLAHSPAYRTDTRETLALKAAYATAPWRVLRTICTLAVFETFLTIEKISLAQTGIGCPLLPMNTESIHDPSEFFLKGSVHLK